ncbi:MAG: hypothetical protein WCD81_00230 [Candidatus Bathyarchaeia archaeon]
MPQGKFNKVLLDAIEGGLSSLGDSPREAIFYHLETSFQLKKENIPLNLSEFKQALERIFGPGAPYLEKIIIRCLYERLGLSFEEPRHVDFVVCVNDAKRQVTREEEVKQYE